MPCRTPWSDVAGTTFRNEGMDMRIPFEVTSKSVEDTDNTGSKVFCFVDFRKHTQNDIADRKEKTVKQGPVIKEINAEFFWNGKNTVSVYTGNEFAGHMKGTHLVIFVSARRTKTAFTAERDEFHGATAGTGKHGTTVRRVTTMDHLVDIFNNSRTGMKLVEYMLIIISKNGL